MRLIVVLFSAIFLLSCSKNSGNVKADHTYFDLDSFFLKEASRLQILNPEVHKSVSRNSEAQTKKVSGINWKNELGLFTESDINKPAWKDSYKVIRTKDEIIYHAMDIGLRTREIKISKNANGSVQKITIENQTINKLYQSFEELLYIPDSLYRIDKKQHILLIGDNQYLISGKFKY
jgi:hypothetical protein